MKTPIFADLDSIIFEGREQDYGAFQMRKQYNRLLTRAMLIAFMLFLSLTALPKVVAWIAPAAEAEKPAPRVEVVDLIHMPDPVEKKEIPDPLPPRTKPQKPKVKTVAFKVPKPTAKDIDDKKTIAHLDSLDKGALGLKNQDGKDLDNDWDSLGVDTSDYVVILPPDPKVKKPGIDDFVLLEKEPAPVNMDELRELIGYPKMAIEAEIEGKVIVRVLVDKYGDYIQHAILKDPHPILTRAVTAQLKQLKVTPGIQAGKPIPVWITIPFDFTLLK